MTDLDSIEARAEAATPGPWDAERDQQNFDGWDVRHPNGYVAYDEMRGALKVEANAAFIAAARTDVPMLCQRVRQLEQQMAKIALMATSNDNLTPAAWQSLLHDIAATADDAGGAL